MKLIRFSLAAIFLIAAMAFLSVSNTPAYAADCPVVSNIVGTLTCTTPPAMTQVDIKLRGAGGAGASGCTTVGGGAGGRGNKADFYIRGLTPGTQLIITTGVGGYAPGACGVLGNIGTATTVVFPNGYTFGAGGAQRGDGTIGGVGGNAFVTCAAGFPGCSVPAGISFGNDNGDVTAGQNATGAIGGHGGGNGDVGGGGNGGNAGLPGTAGTGGYALLMFR